MFGAAALLTPTIVAAQDMSQASDVTRFVLDSGMLIIAGIAGLVAIAGFTLKDIGLARTQNAPQVCLRRNGANLAAFNSDRFRRHRPPKSRGSDQQAKKEP